MKLTKLVYFGLCRVQKDCLCLVKHAFCGRGCAAENQQKAKTQRGLFAKLSAALWRVRSSYSNSSKTGPGCDAGGLAEDLGELFVVKRELAL